MKRFIFVCLWSLGFAAIQTHAADAFLVENGQARAEIIISETPQRSVRLAAADLQTYVEKMSGARLPIRIQPTAGATVRLYVGRSVFTDRLGITADGLKDGAYRLKSGDHWLVLLGDDTDFTPTEPWARNNADRANGKLQQEWEKLSGGNWGVPNGGLYKNRLRLPGDLGKPEGAPTAKNETLEVWGFDERGSFNAVCGFLRRLGVRWYLPGELGEVIPSLKTIPLPVIDETVQPDFPVRRFNIRFGTNGRDTALWAMRLGLRDPNGLQVAHGLATMTGRDEIFAAHPEWFALYGGKRHYQPGSSKNQLCYSNEELFREAVRYARAQFDVYDFETVSIMPPDGYTSICQCRLCAGKDSPERDPRGLLSDHVWDFANRVAKEVAKTHPRKKILCCAYGVYTLPPLKIAKLEPNVVVCIVGGRRPVNRGGEKGEGESAPDVLRAAWVTKTDNPILIFENYPFTDRGWYLPSYVARSIGSGINATKDLSAGEDIWLSLRQDFAQVGIGFNHFMVYFTARMYWGGKEQDVDALLREYCRLFYGPAEKEMLAFFEYCEANWHVMEKDKSVADTALRRFADARAKAPAGSVFDRRLGLIDDYLKGLRSKSEQLGQKRGPVPQLRLVWEAENITIDGRLDEKYWQTCPVAATGRLRELHTGRTPTFGTSFKAGWHGNNVYFAIRCDERPGEKLNLTARTDDDAALWYGDAIEILLETESHSYYQIAVSPGGAVVDLDRGGKKRDLGWDSKAEVATHIAEDHWIAEIRIPVTQDENDPLHQVIGRKPTGSLPWHFNVCRQRVREHGAEYSAFSPTGTTGFHEPMKFAHFFDGKSRQFESDPGVTDYLTASRAAAELLSGRKYAEALAAFVSLAGGKVPDIQKSAALEQAAAAARAMKDFVRADELAGLIPIEAAAKAVRMENLLAQGKAGELVKQFGGEDFGRWPFWKAGDGLAARGRAHVALKAGEKADADLRAALPLIADSRTHLSLLRTIGGNREMNLKDDDRALETYQQIAAATRNNGSAEYYHGVLGAARILTRKGRFDDALAMLDHVDAGKLRGTWRGSLLLARADTLAAAGRKEAALKLYQALATDDSIDARQKKQAADSLARLGK